MHVFSLSIEVYQYGVCVFAEAIQHSIIFVNFAIIS